MTSTPLHPGLVHLPLGLAFVIPLLAIGFAWALWKGRIQTRSWIVIILLQALLVGGGLLAMNTGEHEEGRIKSLVPRQALHEHESLATRFLWAASMTLGLALLPMAIRRPKFVRVLTAGAVLGSFVVAAAALRVGHAGGQLVYVYNAGAAYGTAGDRLAKSGLDPGANVSAEHHHAGHHHEAE